MLQDLGRAFEIEEGIQAIAHGVFDGEVPLNNLYRLWVVFNSALQLQQLFGQLRLKRIKLGICIIRTGVNDGARWQD